MKRQSTWHNPQEAGQAATLVVLSFTVVLLAAAAFTVDISNVFAHRQKAQTAANAACKAGVMDMLVNLQGQSLGGFTVGTGFDCATKASAAPCKYAALNGYLGAGLITKTASNSVVVSFPSGSACPSGAGCPAPGVTPAPASLVTYPFIRVDIVDRVPLSLGGVLTGSSTTDVRSEATCVIQQTTSPAPLQVLTPSNPSGGQTGGHACSVSGSPNVVVKGGGSKCMQVNSSSNNSISCTGGSLNFTKGGPSFSGGCLGNFGGPTGTCPGFSTSGSGSYQCPSTPITDVFASTNKPSVPASPRVPSDLAGRCSSIPCSISYHDSVHSCPDPSGCLLYTGGYYSSGISVWNATAVFDPGLYYLNGGLSIHVGAVVRPGTGTGDGSGGTTFYLTGSSQTCLDQSGLLCVSTGAGWSGVDAYSTANVKCPSGPAPDSRIGLPTTVSGSVLLAPCTGTYGDSLGQYRGMLFFQDRASSVGGGWNFNGGDLLVGDTYFHHCNSSGTGTGCGSTPTYYNCNLNITGNTSSSSAENYMIGAVVSDTLNITGSHTVNMVLNSNQGHSSLKGSLCN